MRFHVVCALQVKFWDVHADPVAVTRPIGQSGNMDATTETTHQCRSRAPAHSKRSFVQSHGCLPRSEGLEFWRIPVKRLLWEFGGEENVELAEMVNDAERHVLVVAKRSLH